MSSITSVKTPDPSSLPPPPPPPPLSPSSLPPPPVVMSRCQVHPSPLLRAPSHSALPPLTPPPPPHIDQKREAPPCLASRVRAPPFRMNPCLSSLFPEPPRCSSGG
ncbi:hypothetical protein FQN60_018304 [Etheostoma spectabile]|uniref:Uncharacterized protein n=1 Tax=Etheostoma spectabile TaxID=54343 RepID=A0A5J5DHV2_9PERO|nr:hypothetical protein FQN60_018304 [Etheostoma spectabile]